MEGQADAAAHFPRARRPATAREAKALGHPLRLRILRLTAQREMTNKQLADRLDRDPGTVLYHVRQLVEAGLLQPVEVRTGESGALEKPYRPAGRSWWIDSPLEPRHALAPFAPPHAFDPHFRAPHPPPLPTHHR